MGRLGVIPFNCTHQWEGSVEYWQIFNGFPALWLDVFAIERLADTVAILIHINSISYYGIPRRQIYITSHNAFRNNRNQIGRRISKTVCGMEWINKYIITIINIINYIIIIIIIIIIIDNALQSNQLSTKVHWFSLKIWNAINTATMILY